MEWKKELAKLSNAVLLARTRECVSKEREKTAWLVAHLAEIERRNLALQDGASSLYQYARRELHLSDKMAYERADAAKLALLMPETIGKLASGELNLTAASALWRTLRDVENAAKAPARRAEARDEALVLSPELPMTVDKPNAPMPKPVPVQKAEVRVLLHQLTGKTQHESSMMLHEWKQERTGQPVTVKPKHELRLQLTEEQQIAWDRMRDLLSHRLGGRNPEAAFAWLLEQGLEKLDPVRVERRADARRAKKKSDAWNEEPLFAAGAADEAQSEPTAIEAQEPATLEKPDQPDLTPPSDVDAWLDDSHSSKPNRVHIPAPTQRRVWIRCEGKCQYPNPVTGQICGSTMFIDFDHIVPLAEGGSNEESNLRLCCANHNRRRHLWQAREAGWDFELKTPTHRNALMPSHRIINPYKDFARAS